MNRLILIAALATGLTLPALTEAAVPQPVYFWGSVVAVIKAPGQPPAVPELSRPSLILLAEDGSSVIEHLQWTGWGSSVAHATGISSASNGIPNMAQGKRITKPAEVTLSNPGLFQGHEVYRCFTLTVAPAATTGPSCLTDRGGYWSLAGISATGTTPKPTTSTAAASASFYSPSHNLSCEIDDGGSGISAQVYCQSMNPPSSVHLGLDGKLVICSGTGAATRCLGNAGENTPTLAYGKQVSVGRFRCSSEQAGVICTVIGSGKGFTISTTGITPVGGAAPTSATLHLAAFLSPDRKVLCVDEQTEHDAWCGTMTPSRLVTLKSNGEVTMCNSAAPAGCLQTWHASAPVLAYAQQTELNGFRCVSEQTGITCTVSGGSNNGKGFRINSAGITRVGA